MKISVIIPTYKPKAYIWECLNSLTVQTFPKEDFEVILVLNGCNEPWKSQIEEYIGTNMHGVDIRLIHTVQAGVSNARNMALDIARGEYITFIDDDDYVSPEYLKGLYQKASYDTISLCYPYAFNDGNVEIQLPYAITDQYQKCSKGGKQPYIRTRKFFSGPCMKLIPMSFIHERRFDPRFVNGEDSLFMFLISDRFIYVDFASDNTIYYRRFRANSATTSRRSRRSIISNEFKRILEYTKIYFRALNHYSVVFYFTRVLGALRTMLSN